jgi:RNA recognition motif-containing protein
MNTKLYVDNLAATLTESELIDLFSTYGNVMSVRVAIDQTSHRPRGFGFVTMVTSEGAQAAVRGLNGKAISGGVLAVSEAWPDEERTSRQRRPRRGPGFLF